MGAGENLHSAEKSINTRSRFMRMEIRNVVRRRISLSLGGLSALAFAAAVDIQPPAVPDNLKVPDGQIVLLKALGQGVQIYTCRAKAGDATQFEWVFKARRPT
jgi:hypothetical protein